MTTRHWSRGVAGTVVCLAVLAGAAGCRRAPPPPPPPPPPPLPADLQDARALVQDYLAALAGGDYVKAYGLLSADSRRAISQEEFSDLADEGLTEFQEEKATVVRVSETEALVTVQLYEDPAEHGFRVVEEDGVWRVMMRGGTPSMPEAGP